MKLKINKPLKIVIIVLTSLLTLYFVLHFALASLHGNFQPVTDADTATRPGKVTYVTDTAGTPYLCKTDEAGNILDEDFKILVTSDLHLRDANADFTVEVLARFMEKEKPDLVVLNGDLVHEREDAVMQQKLIDLFTSKEQYFAITLGNHDAAEYVGKIDNPRAYFYSLFECPYLVSYNDPAAVDGYGNCAVNVKTAPDKIVQTLYFMDTRQNDYSQNQITWYQNKVEEITAENGGTPVKSVVFSHIQLYEFKTAYALCQTENSDCVLNYGDKLEPIDGPDVTNGFFDIMLALGSTQAYVAGHDHNSDLNFTYHGVTLMFDQPLSYQSYTRRGVLYNTLYLINQKCDYFNDGVNILMIGKDGSFTNVAKYAQHEQVFDGLSRYYCPAKIIYFKKSKNNERS